MTTITFCLIHFPPKGTCDIATRMTFLKLSHSYPWPPELWLNFLAWHPRCLLRWPCLFLPPPCPHAPCTPRFWSPQNIPCALTLPFQKAFPLLEDSYSIWLRHSSHCHFSRKSFLFLFLFWGMPCDIQDLSSLTRDQTCAPCIWNMESQPPDCQGNPRKPFLKPHSHSQHPFHQGGVLLFQTPQTSLHISYAAFVTVL